MPTSHIANPSVTVARALSDTFAGVDPAHVTAFIAAQLVGAVVGLQLWGWLVSAETGD